MSLDERIRFGVVGCGGFTRAHLALMASVPGWELAGIVEPDAVRRKEAALLVGLEESFTFAEESAFYQCVRPEVVFVHTPVTVHADNCRRAVEAGAHVCCQKPFVHDLAAGVELARLARVSGRVISVGQTMRTHAVSQTILRTIQEGTIGEPRFGHRTVYRNRMGLASSYHYKEAWPSIHVMGSHWMDLYRYLFGTRVSRVSFRGIACDWDPYDDAGAVTGWIEMETGAVMTCQESFISQVPDDPMRAPFEDNVIQGEKGAIHWTGPWGAGPVELWQGGEEKAIQIDVGGLDGPPPMKVIMDALAASVRESEPMFCPAEDNLWTMAALFAAQQSAERDGAVVDVLALGRASGLE